MLLFNMLVADIGEAQRKQSSSLAKTNSNQDMLKLFATLDGHLCQDDYTLLIFYAWEHIYCINKLNQSVFSQ